MKSIYESIRNAVQALFPTSEVTLVDAQKIGGAKPVIVVRLPGANVAPAIYLDRFADASEDDVDEIAEQIRDIVIANAETERTEKMQSEAEIAVQQWRDRIQVQLMRPQGNEDYLSDKVWRQFLDMGKIYKIHVLTEGDSNATIAVKKDMLSNMGATEDEVDAVATENTRNKNVPRFKNIVQVLLELMGENFAGLTPQADDSLPMYVLSNQAGINGAVFLLFNDILDDCLKQMGEEDTVILPSSVHEILLVPASFARERGMDGLVNMVGEINDTQVPPEDLLSYSVYYYRKGGELKILEPSDIGWIDISEVAGDEDAELDIAQ